MNTQISILSIYMFISFCTYAQVGKTKDEIINIHGDTYKTGISDKGNEYIYYENEYKTTESGTYIQTQVYYLKKDRDGVLFCNHRKVFEPSSEINSWVKYYNKKNFVKIDNLKWKNYENNLIYHLSLENRLCILNVYFESE